MIKNYFKKSIQAFFGGVVCIVGSLSDACGQETEDGEIRGCLRKNYRCLSGTEIQVDSAWRTKVDSSGCFSLKNIPYGRIHLKVLCDGQIQFQKRLNFSKSMVFMDTSFFAVSELDEVVISGNRSMNGLDKLGEIRGTSIFAAKRNDIILLDKMDANLVTNTTRQIFSKVAGVNVWENDGSGIQVNVSTRGLSPNRSWEFNMRQNEYDIAADIFGYPDMYYSPPMEAISSIEVVRGAASLQYGTQIGGLLNFKLKRGPVDKPLEVESRQTIGSYGLVSTYNSAGGQKNKFSYFGYFNYRSADGWRQNADYKWKTGHIALGYDVSEKLKISAEYTRMQFGLHLAAGLSEAQYAVDNRQSVRERNWFNILWNIPSININYKLSDDTYFSLVSSALIGHRFSNENTKPVTNVVDTGFRDMRKDRYLNFSNEARFVAKYQLFNGRKSVLAGGVRLYKGRTGREQGWGSRGRDANFDFVNPNKLEYNDYVFHTTNVAVFAENIFKITDKLSVVPGVRYEYLLFKADGYYNAAGTLYYEKNLTARRNFPLFGMGVEYKVKSNITLYANATQGYRSANFNDIRITAPNVVVDPNLKDSRGNNMDIGARIKHKNIFSGELSVFYLKYNDKIGLVSRTRTDNSTYVFSTNVSDALHTGFEFFSELNVMKLMKEKSKTDLYAFLSYAYTNARYVSSDKDFLTGKKVEFAPKGIMRYGATFKTSNFSATVNNSNLSKQYSDANNTVSTVNGVNGIVPAYTVFDFSTSYTYKQYRIEANILNFTNEKYFTRRAASYPGPGIIPADPTTFSLTFALKM